jgi:hypothetical protein
MKATPSPPPRCPAATAPVLAVVPVLAAAALLAVLTAGCGSGRGADGTGTPSSEASPLVPSPARLVVTTDGGLRLRPAAGDEVEVDRRVGRHWSRHAGTWVLDLSCPPPSGGPCPRMPEVDVPAGTAVTVSARNAGVDAAGVRGALTLATVNGDVTVTRSGGDAAAVRLETRNGSVRATDVRARVLHAETVNGDVTLDCAGAPVGITATTTNGSVRATVPHDAPAYRVTGTTVNGRATAAPPTRAGGDGPTMTLGSVNGDVTAGRD